MSGKPNNHQKERCIERLIAGGDGVHKARKGSAKELEIEVGEMLTESSS